MKFLSLTPLMLLLASCTSHPKMASPLGLSEAIRTLPSEAVAGMSRKGRQEYLVVKSGDYDEATRRLHLYDDNPHAGGDAESMLFLRLFEDEEGRTIAAAHSARPFADGREPSEKDTFVYRFESGRWVEITDAVLPSGVSRSWWFRFSEDGAPIPCGPYEPFSRRDGRGSAFRFGEAEGTISWRDGAFRLALR